MEADPVVREQSGKKMIFGPYVPDIIVLFNGHVYLSRTGR
jgi:hypothetical protein